MSQVHQAISVVAILMLFIFGLQSLSHELQKLIGDRLKGAFSWLLDNYWRSVLAGIFTTAIVQSSSAVTALVVSLVGKKIVPLSRALAVIVGANVGTASTAFIVSFRLEFLGAYLIVLGSILSFWNARARVIGKSLFFFGFILFVLDQLGFQLRNHFEPNYFRNLIAEPGQLGFLQTFWGFLLTVIFQSSSLTTGFIVTLGSQGFIDLQDAIFFILGANVGTTSTGLIASVGFDRVAKQAALGNFLFNLWSAFLIFPFVIPFSSVVSQLAHGNTALAIAFSHLFFNLILLLLVTPFLNLFERLLKSLLPDKG
ncbi:MAG: Na/Pi symporter [Bdellovibrionaceae bacterium]|nr:Na/Pi symporter [Pseudobdellovibrionaceae bacterium]MDW8190822.1 Na/Pi symporter [Pseudobdellovibrionaceae bacterium]